MKLIPHKKSPAVLAWLKTETSEQQRRYRQIEKYINVTLTPQRNKWIAGFLERIQTRGYSVHYDQLRKITRAELPKEPRRKHRFVY
jgi:ppGpp synthetase/RelA/SpoT-type nucleotidyltranferase